MLLHHFISSKILKTKAILLIVLLASMSVSNASEKAELPKTVKRLILKGHYKEALPELTKLVQQDNEEAQFQLGKLYLQGVFGEKDEQRALVLFEQSAKQGHAKAQFYAAQLLIDQEGFSERALTYLQLAAAQDHKMAIASLESYANTKLQTNQPEQLSQFWDACRQGDLVHLNEFVEQGIDINQQDTYGNDAMLIATQADQTMLVAYLMKHGANTSQQNNEGNTALLTALRLRNTKAAELIASSKNINIKNKDGMSPVYLAVLLNDEKTLVHLLQLGADAEVSYQGQSAYQLASKKNSQSLMKTLLKYGAKASAQNQTLSLDEKVENLKKQQSYPQYSAWSLLKLAAWAGDSELITWALLDKNLSENDFIDALAQAFLSGDETSTKKIIEAFYLRYQPSEKDFLAMQMVVLENQNIHLFSQLYLAQEKTSKPAEKTNSYLLDKAISSKQSKFVDYLLGKNIDSKYINASQESILIHLIKMEMSAQAIKVVDYNVDLDGKDKFGRNALWYAANQGDFGLAEALIKKHANINLLDNQHQTALAIAILNKNPKLALYFIEQGADLSLVNQNGNTALHLAVSSEQDTIVNTLLKTKIDISLRNKSSFTALMLAVQNQNFEITQLLLKSGANPKRKDKNGMSAFDYAKDKEIVKLLDDY